MRQKQPLEGSGGNGGTRAAGQCKGQAMDPNGTNKLSGLSPLPPPGPAIKVGTSVPLADPQCGGNHVSNKYKQ